MLKTTKKGLLTSLIVLAAAIAGPANAATLYHPIANGGCGASDYQDHNYYGAETTYLSVPEIPNGGQVLVHGVTFQYSNNYFIPVSATFSCSNGVLSTDNPYQHSVSWEPYY